MLHIILTILKIIGILLLLIIGLLLAIILCVLFLPIRYYGNGKYNKDERNLQIKARYLFGIIRFNANWEENNRNISFKVFAKDMLKERSSKKKKAKKTTKGANKSNAATKKKDIAAARKEKDLNTTQDISVNTAVNKVDKTKDTVKETSTKEKTLNTCSVEDNSLDICSVDRTEDNTSNICSVDNASNENNATNKSADKETVDSDINSIAGNDTNNIVNSIADSDTTNIVNNVTDSDTTNVADSDVDNITDSDITIGKKNNIIFKLKRFIDKILNFKNKLKAFVQSFIKKAKHFLEKLRNINNRKNEYIEFLTDERSKTAIKEIKRLLGVTFKHIRPTKVKGCIRFGTGEPDTTGQLLGLISIFTSDYFKKLSLEADFDNEVIDIDVKFKGRIRIINLVIVAIKLYKIDRLKEFISFVKQ